MRWSSKDDFASKEPFALATAAAETGVGCSERAGDLAEVGAIDI
jgi:hypothetical protein